MHCKICEKDSFFEKINTYKHVWFYCKKCKNIFSEKKIIKDSYLKKILVNFLSKITKQNRLKKLLLSNNTSTDEVYDYRNNITGDGNYFPSENNFDNKWSVYDKDFINYLKNHNIDLNSKKILSVSDEPGLIVNELKKYTSINNITLTAFDQKTSNFMSEKLNCNVKKFDLNNDKLSEIVDEKFDLIFFRSTLNFNLNFDSLLYELNKISNNHSKIIFNFHSPTTASCLMWMFDDYTLLSLININYLKPIFKKNDFEIIFNNKVIFNPRKYYYNSISKKIFYYPFYLIYLIQFIIKNILKKTEFKISINEIGYKLVLKKEEK